MNDMWNLPNPSQQIYTPWRSGGVTRCSHQVLCESSLEWYSQHWYPSPWTRFVLAPRKCWSLRAWCAWRELVFRCPCYHLKTTIKNSTMFMTNEALTWSEVFPLDRPVTSFPFAERERLQWLKAWPIGSRFQEILILFI